MALEEDRNEQEHNKSVTASYMDASNTSQGSQGNMTAASFMSATTVNTKEDKEGDFADQFCDFEELQKKWGKTNVDQVRNTLRVMLCRNLVNNAEGHHMREQNKARQKD